MNSCPLCERSLSETRPNHHVVLEIEDTTRSTTQFMGDETSVRRYCVDRRVCAECWDDLRGKLA
ncbi:MAG TPA: hypothetical protein VFJ06_06790 [Halococcus sp.]|nr:hypothetical protein [Halococcus sp.]